MQCNVSQRGALNLLPVPGFDGAKILLGVRQLRGRAPAPVR